MVLSSQLKQTLLKVKRKNFTVQNLASSYDKISKDYSKNFNYQLTDCYLQLLNLLGGVNNKTVLDLGCGTGWFGKLLYTKYSPIFYHGIDISTGMIYEARKTLSENSNLKLEHGNFQAILELMPDNSYDVVFLNWSLKFNNFRELFSKVLRILKPDGKLALLTETNNSEFEINDAISKLIANNINQINLVLPKTFLPSDSHELTKYFNETNFKQTIVWNKSQDYNFQSPIEVSSWARLTGLLAAWDQILDFQEPHLLEEFISLIKPTIPGKFLITKKILGAIAKK
ncbi:MAG: hypothetical protein PWQ67_1928 [Clostridia bacterium]|jgi:ubiquinone/menaquinone biosynthesis C-methylase UbiE|nr:hypothetical protein [Clostridia bacterium]MDN5323474.1 hypothetical protein [Clostridia bacterium]